MKAITIIVVVVVGKQLPVNTRFYSAKLLIIVDHVIAKDFILAPRIKNAI